MAPDYYSSDDNFYDSESEDEGTEDEGEDDEAEEVAEIELKPCSNCGRNFNPDVLTRHYTVCSKLKPRKAFDSSKQRLEGIPKVPVTASSSTPPKPKKKDWRWQHQEFIKNIRAARGAKFGDGAPPPTPNINPDYIQCPHCKRRFNEGAAERHIDFCKEQKSRIPKQNDNQFANKKEKMDKRSTYKPPLPGKKKLSGGNTPVKANTPVRRKDSNSAPADKRPKGKPSPAHNNSSGERATKSDTTIPGQRRKKAPEAKSDERQDTVTNSRYSKTPQSANSRLSSGGSMSDNESPKSRSAKNKNAGEPKWFEDLKRNDSGSQLRRNNLQADLDAVDSGLDINENYPRTTVVSNKNTKESPVGVVRPSSRTTESEFVLEKGERTALSGRRKMANFCHDCGTRYPVTEAKFCCECGVKRMLLT